MKSLAGIMMLTVLQLGNAYAEEPKFIAPEMVNIPPGKFIMGSVPNEPERLKNEDPRHEVTISYPFALGKYEVTFAEWDACVADGGCNGYKPDDNGWGRGKLPVLNVSWKDAHAYIDWINKKTGKQYRLPSEAEWEYAARGGTTTAFYWGNDIGENNANCAECDSQWDDKQTSPVGSFKPNPFGLYDMSGNVWEWTEDEYHNSYVGAPADGSVWRAKDEDRHVRRGGAWHDDADDLRVARRGKQGTVIPPRDVGFRLALTLR